MRLHKTGVYAPKTQAHSMTTKDGRRHRVDTTLKTVKNAITKGFAERQQTLLAKKADGVQ